MANLCVQLDQVATLRQSRKTIYPDPIAAAVLVEMAGAEGIAVHLREDRRHIQDRDLRILRRTVQTKLILKMTATSEMLGVALNIKPDRVVLVPEKREDISIEGGLDMMVHKSTVAETVGTLQNSGIPVGILIDPDPEQLKLAHQSNANFVEVQAGTYSEATTTAKRNQAFSKIVDSVKLAYRLKIGAHLSHGLDYSNIKPFTGLNEISEFCVGHSIIARAVMIGLDRAVKEMRLMIGQGSKIET